MTQKSTKSRMPRSIRAKSSKKPAATIRHLKAALKTDGADRFVDALGTMVRAKGAARVAKKAGISKRQLTGAFSPKAKSEVAALLERVRTVGFKLTVIADAA